jgi:hypothetical protein
MLYVVQKNKYRNKKVRLDGIVFASHHEAAVYLDIKDQKRKGLIKDFKLQVPFELVPKQTETAIIITKNKKQKQVERVAERSVKYIADFVVYHHDGTFKVVDAKGDRNLDPKYGIKRKLMRWRHNIIIYEV